MDRRDFSKGLLLSGMAAPLVLRSHPAQSTIIDLGAPQGGEGGGSDSVSRIQLQFGTTIIVLTFLIILLANGPVGFNLKTPVKRFSAKRADTSNIPILGDLTRKTLASQFANAPLIGHLYLMSTILVMVPLIRNLQPPKKSYLTHHDWDYELPNIPKPLKLSSPIVAENFRKSESIGNAVKNSREFLFLVRPHVAIEGV